MLLVANVLLAETCCKDFNSVFSENNPLYLLGVLIANQYSNLHIPIPHVRARPSPEAPFCPAPSTALPTLWGGPSHNLLHLSWTQLPPASFCPAATYRHPSKSFFPAALAPLPLPVSAALSQPFTTTPHYLSESALPCSQGWLVFSSASQPSSRDTTSSIWIAYFSTHWPPEKLNTTFYWC